jgi:sulfur carrier protein
MKICVNGETREVTSQTLDELVIEMDMGEAPVATALNQTFVRKKDRATTRLQEGDAVEILTPRQGG